MIRWPPTAGRAARLTVLVCGSSALLTLALALTSVPRRRVRDLPFLLFPLTPYLALAALATARWQARRWVWSLFAHTLALSLAGVGCFALDSWTFHTVADYRMQQRFTVIVVPMLQLAARVPLVVAGLVRSGRQ
jgi:hypothetical protein